VACLLGKLTAGDRGTQVNLLGLAHLLLESPAATPPTGPLAARS
jgi:hypothetical protein